LAFFTVLKDVLRGEKPLGHLVHCEGHQQNKFQPGNAACE